MAVTLRRLPSRLIVIPTREVEMHRMALASLVAAIALLSAAPRGIAGVATRDCGETYDDYKRGMLAGVTDRAFTTEESRVLIERYDAPSPHDDDLPAVGLLAHLWTKTGVPGGYLIVVHAADQCVRRAGTVEQDILEYLLGKGPLPERFGRIDAGI
jgi:hypothetical protein